MTNHTDLIAQLNNGWVARPKRWSGDTHHDFPYGNLDDKATDLLMEEAADALEAAQAEIDMHMRVATNAIDHVVTLKAEIEAVRKANVDCVNHFDALRIDYDKALARIAKLEPKRNVSPPSEALVLHKMRYHFWKADDDEPADFELFDAGVECDTCIDVALVRQDRLDELIAALARLAELTKQEPVGYLYDWVHRSSLGRGDATYTGFTKDKAHAEKHDNAIAIYAAAGASPQPSQADAQDAARYRWLQSNAYVGIAPYPKPHEVWCTKLPNPAGCNSLDAAIDAAINAKESK